MQVGKTSIFVLSLLLSYEAFGANAAIRAGALRLNQPQNSVSSAVSKTEKQSTSEALSSYNRASSLRPNRVQVSGGGNKNPAVNEELLNKVYEEMERVTSAVEQELYLTSREIKTLKDEIAEKDEKIKDLELALEDYEEMKETVKNIPNIYYSKREVDSKGYVMPSTLSSAIETAKNTVKKEALAEVNSKGFITSSAVADEIAQAKNAAVSAAVAQVENMNFATANSVAAAETRLANAIDSAKATITNERNAALQLYAKTSDVASEITLAKNTAIADAKTQTIAAIEDKNYATQQFVNTELSNLDLGIDEVAVGTIIENKLLAKDYATKSFAENKASAALNEAKSYTNTSVYNETTSRQAAINTIDSRLLTYATRSEVDDMVEEAVDPEGIATGLLNNNQFKTELLSAVNQNVSALSTRVGALEEEDGKINNRLATFSTKQELSDAVTDINNTINNLELGINEKAVISIIGSQFSENKVLTENSPVFTAVKDTVDAIPKNYYNMKTVDDMIADAASGGDIDLSGYLAKNELVGALKNISDTEICLTMNCVSGQVANGISALDGLDERVDVLEAEDKTIKEQFKLYTKTTDLPNVITKDYLMEKLGNTYALQSDVSKDSLTKTLGDTYLTSDDMDKKYALKSVVDELKTKVDAIPSGGIDLSEYLKKSEVKEGNLTKMKDGLLMTSTDTANLLKDYVLEGKLKEKIEGIKTSDDKQLFITRNNVDEVLSNTYATKNAVDSLGTRVDELKTKVDAIPSGGIDLSEYLKKSEVKEGNLTKMKDGLLMTTSDFTKELVISKITGKETCTTEDCLFEDYTTTEDLEKYYAAKSDLNDYVLEGELKEKIEGIKTSDDKQLFITRNNVNEVISKDSLVEDLLNDESFKAALGGAVVDGLEDLPSDVVTLQTNVANLQTGVASLQEKDTEIDGKINTMQGTIDGLSNTYATKKELTDAVSEGNLTETLNGVYLASGALNNYYTKEETKSYVDDAVSAGKLQEKIEGIVTSDGEQLFITRDNVNEAINKDSLANALLANGTFTAGLNNTYYTKAETNKAIEDAVDAEATERTSAGYLTSSSLSDYSTTGKMNEAIATAKDEAITAVNAVNAKIGELSEFVTDGEATVANAIAGVKSTADKASATAETASETASAAQSAADKASATAETASEIASAAQTAAEAVDGKIGNLSKFVTDENATVADAIAGVDDKIGELSGVGTGNYTTVAEAINGVDGKIGDLATVASSKYATVAEAIAGVDDKIGDLAGVGTGNYTTVAEAISGVDTAVETLETNALTVQNYCSKKPTECTGGTEEKQQ